jgi:hypothetical protein
MSVAVSKVFGKVTVAKVPLYQSPINCRSRNLEGNITHKVRYY